MTPLEIFEIRWQGNGLNAPGVPSVPYFDVVNIKVDLDGMPDIWGAALIQPDEDNDITMGSMPWVVERGVIVIGLFGKSGLGPKSLQSEVDEVKAAFHGWQSDGLRISKVDGPLDVDPEADGNWWRVALTASYEYTYQRNATGQGFADMNGLNH
jgi:hypothetical protein